MNLVSQQPSMQTAAHIAGYVVYTNYKPHLLKDDIFPIPLLDMNNLKWKPLLRFKILMVKKWILME